MLTANGLTSKEIANRLYLAKRTVDTHLDRIYRKLGVGGRDELDAALTNAVGG
jgi:DNA-binding CsgD family transcriptional regulator